MPKEVSPSATAPTTVAIRPGDLLLQRLQTAGCKEPVFEARIAKVEDHGADLVIPLRLEADPHTPVALRIGASHRDEIASLAGGLCRIVAPIERMHFFDGSGRRIECDTGSVLPLPAIGLSA
ncbi:MAG: hypothetical protein QNJ30_02225 [Kiloniellales bacterium]|nr:hypothetical protein [Kiloniellales bacterium]